jgi:AraC-like DNA-binding protein
MFAHQALSLFSPDSGWTTTMAPYLERSLLAIAIGCIFESLPDVSPHASTIDRPLRQSIERYIHDNLADQHLDVSRICHEFGLSRSVVYRMFQAHSGLNRYILGCRLRQVRRLLLERDDRSIAEIAYACGFISPAHFSREFRRAFGAAPSEMRQHRSRPAPEPVQASSLDQILRSITH